MAKTPKTLSFPPFPPLTWSGIWWEGAIELPTWTGYRMPPMVRYSKNNPEPSGAATKVCVKPADNKQRESITPEQIAAFSDLLERETVINKAVIRAVNDYVQKIRQENIGLFGDTEDEFDVISQIRKASDLRRFIQIGSVHILPESKSGTSFIGFHVGCEWDPQYGTDVMTHRGKVINTGSRLF